jgi:uncharacterized protein DUF4919
VASIEAGDASADYQALRFAYAETPNFDPYARPAVEKRDLIAAVNSGNLEQALDYANRILAQNYTDMDAHYALYIVYEKSGEHAKADFQRAVVQGLMKSFTDSGDGTSEETAMTAVAEAEEYAFLGLKGYQVLREGLSPSTSGPVHVFAVTTRDNQGTTVYFKANRIFAKLKNGSAPGFLPPRP